MEAFINPGLLWFLGLGAIPIIIHLLNRQRYRRVRWAAMEWLLAALRKTQRRLRLENLLLLLIRILIIVLLVLALARPFFRTMPLKILQTTDRLFLLVVDNSYSMGKLIEGVSAFERAKKAMESILDSASPAGGDRVAIVLMSSRPSALIAEPSMQMDRARKLVADLALSDHGSSLVSTLPLVIEILAQATNSQKDVYIITDFQRYAWDEEGGEDKRLGELLKKLGDAASSVTFLDVGCDSMENTGIVSLKSEDRVAISGTVGRFKAVVKNFGVQEVVSNRLQIFQNGQKVAAVPFHVAAGGEVTVPFQLELKDPQPLAVSVEIESDALPGDNRRHLAMDVRESLKTLIINGAPAAEIVEDETIFLQLALNPSRDPAERVSYYTVDTETKFTYADVNLRKYDLVIMANLDAVIEEKVRELEEFVHAGGGLLIFLGDKVDRAVYNSRLYRGGEGLLPCELTEIRGDKEKQRDLRFEKVDFTHPALTFFVPFKQRLNDFITFEYFGTKVDTARPDVRVLARYNDTDSSAAIVEKSFGRGAVVLVTTTCDRDWNIWSLSFNQAYLILMDQLCLNLAAQPLAYKNLQVGDSIEYTLRHGEYTKAFGIRTPGGGVIGLTPAQIGGENGSFVVVYHDTDSSGVYALERSPEAGGPAELKSYFALNVDPQEGNLARITPTEISRRFPEFKFTYVGEMQNEESEKIETKPPVSHIWKVLMYCMLGLLVVEMVLAQRFARHR